MSVDQKQNVVLRTLEQERHDLDKANIFKKKDEDAKKSSSSSTSDESSSESETGKVFFFFSSFSRYSSIWHQFRNSN